MLTYPAAAFNTIMISRCQRVDAHEVLRVGLAEVPRGGRGGDLQRRDDAHARRGEWLSTCNGTANRY